MYSTRNIPRVSQSSIKNIFENTWKIWKKHIACHIHILSSEVADTNIKYHTERKRYQIQISNTHINIRSKNYQIQISNTMCLQISGVQGELQWWRPGHGCDDHRLQLLLPGFSKRIFTIFLNPISFHSHNFNLISSGCPCTWYSTRSCSIVLDFAGSVWRAGSWSSLAREPLQGDHNDYDDDGLEGKYNLKFKTTLSRRFIEDQEEKKERLVAFFRKNITNKWVQETHSLS